MKTPVSTLALLAIAACALLAADKPATPSRTLAEYKFGAALSGDAVASDQLVGKAVLIDSWGIHCGPCLGLLPEIEKTSRRYKDKLVVVGAHMQSGTDAEIMDVVKKNKLSYPIVKGYSGPISGNGLPHVHVFDATGAMLFEGSPFDKDYEKMLRRAIASVKK